MENTTKTWTNDTQEDFECCSPGLETILVPVVFSLIVILGCIGNILVIMVVLKNKSQFRNTTNLFILNLSVADLLFLVFCVPFHAVIYTVLNWPFGDFMCRFVHLVQYSSMIASVYTLVAMATDRFMAIAYALETKHIRVPCVALLVAVITWIIALAMASPWPIVYSVRTYGNTNVTYHACADDWGQDEKYKRGYFLLLFLLSYAVPVVCIFVLSSLMIRQLWLIKGPKGPRFRESRKAKRKVTKLVIVVVMVFLICWLPNHVVWLWTSFFPDTWELTYTFYYMRMFAHVLSYANSSMNPILYAFLSRNFRRYFHRAVHCKFEGRLSPTQSSVLFQRTTSYVPNGSTAHPSGCHRLSYNSDHDTSV